MGVRARGRRDDPRRIHPARHYLGEIDAEVEAALAHYLRAIQGEHGGWPLFHGGEFDLSASVKAYFALKAAGDDADAPHMARARAAILAHGGAARCNVFTRIQLALFGELPWRAVPVMPVEIMLLPRWFPFHLDKVSYWSRTVLVPLLVLMAKRPRARNPRARHRARTVRARHRGARRRAARARSGRSLFNAVDHVLRRGRAVLPQAHARQRAIDAAVDFVRERLNGEDGLGGIYPAMANAVMMFDCLGYAKRRMPLLATAKAALQQAAGARARPLLSASPACRRCGTPGSPRSR